MMHKLATEAVAVGVMLAAVLALVAAAVPRALRGVLPVAMTGFCVGVAIHLVFEAMGLNAVYCSSGYACLKQFLKD